MTDNRAMTIIGEWRRGSVHFYDTLRQGYDLTDKVVYRHGRALLFRAHPHYGVCKPVDVTDLYTGHDIDGVLAALDERNAQAADAAAGVL